MPKLRLETIILPKKTQVLITNIRLPIASEILNQLRSNSQIEILTSAGAEDVLPDISALGVVVHLVGFDHPSLSETLSYTTELYKLLQLCKSYDAQLFLVLPNSRNHLYHSAITMVTQFSKNFPLNYQIIEIDPKFDLSETAYEIIKKFIHRHSKPKLAEIPAAIKITKPEPTIKTHPPKSVHKKLILPKFPTFSFKRKIAVLLSVVGVVLIPYLLFLLTLFILLISVSCLGKSIQTTQFTWANRCSNVGIQTTGLLITFDSVLPGAQLLTNRFGVPPQELNSVLTTSTQVTAQLVEIESTTGSFLNSLVQPTAETESVSISKITTLLNTLSESLATLQSDIRSWYSSTDYPPTQIGPLAEHLTKTKTLISKFQGLSEEWPTLLGETQKQTYLILIQDNTELKPSGGYIDSLLLLTLENSKLTNTELLTSQAADSQLNGQVESPPDFMALTGTADWYLRDSNWDPDFPVTAKRAAWFAAKEIGRPIDGVIAINQKTLSEWLKVLGPVKIDSKDLVITSENLTESYLANLNTSSQSILYEVLEKIIDKSKSLQHSQLNSLAISFMLQLESREIFIYPTSFTSLGLESANWSGGVGLPGCRSQLPCITDYVYSTDTNIGVNKADYYVSKNFDTQVTIDSSTLLSKHTFDYKNSSTQSVWPEGDYQNYFRLFLPATSKVTAITLNGDELLTSQYTLASQNNLQLLGVSIKVSAGSSSQLVVETSSPLKLNSKTHYQLEIPNQPGVLNYSRKVTINYPAQWFTTVYNTNASLTPSVASPGLLRYNTSIATPISLDIDIAPNN